jgi:hypothetical protein
MKFNISDNLSSKRKNIKHEMEYLKKNDSRMRFCDFQRNQTWSGSVTSWLSSILTLVPNNFKERKIFAVASFISLFHKVIKYFFITFLENFL